MIFITMAIDPDKLFGLFGNSGDSSGKFDKKGYDYKRPDTLPKIDEKDPKYFLGMFYKLIMNHLNYSPELIEVFKKALPELNTDEIATAGEYMVYTRAYEHLQRFDKTDPYHLRALVDEKDYELEVALKMSIKFFEGEEEYERCAYIKEVLDLLLK